MTFEELDIPEAEYKEWTGMLAPGVLWHFIKVLNGLD